MEYRRLGRTGVWVSKLCLGAMMFGEWGTKDHAESIRIIQRALDAGINFIDTADVYSEGESEVIVGKALAGGRRDDIVLATKVHMPMGEDQNRRGNSRRWIIREVEDSLRRLGPTGSTCTRSTATTRIPTSMRRSALLAIWSTAARSVISGIRPSRSLRLSRASGRRESAAASGSCPSSRHTRSSPAPSRPMYCPPALGTGWA